MDPCIGLVPAAGRGLRFGLSGFSKELFPLLVAGGEPGAEPQVRPVCDFALRAVRTAGASRAVVVVSPDKAELMRVLGAGEELDLALAYVVQRRPEGLPHAIAAARPWIDGHEVVLALPDTVILPGDALARVRAERARAGADLVLGVFPVAEPERLGPVELDDAGRVIAIRDKPPDRRVMNSWAIAAWSPRFTAFCCDWDRRQADAGDERVLGHAFEAARAAGLAVGAIYFADGEFLDIGTPRGLRTTIATLTERGLLHPPR